MGFSKMYRYYRQLEYLNTHTHFEPIFIILRKPRKNGHLYLNIKMRIWHMNGKIIFNYVLEIDNFIENVSNINIMVLNIVQYQ